MSGTRVGGLAAAKSNKARYGKDFYKIQGAKGGAASGTGGFWADRELASRAGRLGGLKSRRRKVIKEENQNDTVISVSAAPAKWYKRFIPKA